MSVEHLRPWGRFSWTSSKLPNKEWSFIGCLSTEDRYIAAINESLSSFNLSKTLFIDVIDKGTKYLKQSQAIKQKHRQDLTSLLGSAHQVMDMGLLDSPKILKKNVEQFIASANRKIIIDISCFPKRYFFPILKILYKSTNVDELIACYSLPETYHSGDLAEDPLPWAHIPMFQGSEKPLETIEKAIVGVGFLPFGLPSLLKNDYSNAKLTLLFPFPPGPPNYHRTWDFVREIEKFYPLTNPNQILRIDIKDVPGCYQHLNNITAGGSIPSILAPYGPKTQSLAMALFAINNEFEVFYTQPELYHPEYSIGIRKYNASAEIYSYCLKLGGHKLY